MSKILPSLFDLYAREYHGVTDSSSFLVQLIARSEWTTRSLQTTLLNRLKLPSVDSIQDESTFEDAKRAFVQRCSYVQVSSYHSAAVAEAVLSHPTASSITPISSFAGKADLMNTSTDKVMAADVSMNEHCLRKIVYFSLPPQQYLPVLRALHHHPPSDNESCRAILELVLEKPVGSDQASARIVIQVCTSCYLIVTLRTDSNKQASLTWFESA